MSRKQCPYCGEEIAATAKKCRFCGEWLEEVAQVGESLAVPVAQSQPATAGYAEAVPMGQPIEVATLEEGEVPAVVPNQPMAQAGQPVISPNVNPGQTVMSVGGQPIVLNIQQNQTVEQNVEQTVVVEGGGGSGEAPGWIFTEMWVMAAGIGLALKSWWWFLGIGLGGSILLMVPYIGAVMCVVIGLGWGLLAGAVGATFFSSAAGWVLGILVSLGAVYGHLEARKQNMEE